MIDLSVHSYNVYIRYVNEEHNSFFQKFWPPAFWQTTGLTLCHLRLNENLGAATARTVLQGYRNRYRQLVDVVTERQPTFREDLLATVSTVALLTAPISDVAARWLQS